MDVRRLGSADRDLARRTFAMMTEVFDDEVKTLSDAYLDRLLGRESFWALAAVVDGVPIGGLTAHTLDMTRAEQSEVFVYDLAVHPDQQRRGVGRALMRHLVDEALATGVDNVFVPADNDDAHALDFYRAIGGAAEEVTIFTYDSAADVTRTSR